MGEGGAYLGRGYLFWMGRGYLSCTGGVPTVNLGGGGVTTLDKVVATLDRVGTYLGQGGYLSWTGGIPNLDRGYLPWTGGIYLGPWGYLPWMGGPTLDGGYLTWTRGYLPWGYPSGWMGIPPPPPGRQSSTASTCYTAGGMPLAFTQDILVEFVFDIN